MGGKSSTSTTKTELPPQIVKAYEGLLAQATPISQTAYQPYTGGFEANQTAGFKTIGDLAGSSNGYFSDASGALGAAPSSAAAASAAAGVPTSASVGQYMSPYLSNVAQATMANMNEQNAEQQQGVLGNAAAQGALGGNRVGVAQAELARQQNLANQSTIANLYNTGYNSALGAAQSDKAANLQASQQLTQAQLGAASGYSGLGQTAMQTNLAQAAAQVGAGTQQQQWNYQQYQNARSYPFETTSWLANIVEGLGSGMGGTTTSKQPSGNTGSAVLGGLLGLASLFNRGGVVGSEERPHRAQGGIIPYTGASGIMAANNNQPGAANDNGGYVPQVATAGIAPGKSTLPQAPQGGGQQDQGQQMLQQGVKAAEGRMKEKYPNGILAGQPTPAAPAGIAGSPAAPEVVPDPSSSPGLMSKLGTFFGFADGGVARHGYDGGGVIDPSKITPDELMALLGTQPVTPSPALAGVVAPKTDRLSPSTSENFDDRFGPVTSPGLQAVGKPELVTGLNNNGNPIAGTPYVDPRVVTGTGGPHAAPPLPPPVTIAPSPKVAGVVSQPQDSAEGVVPTHAASKMNIPVNGPAQGIYDGFMNTVRGKINNPYGLAAVATTGSAESGFAPGNAYGAWADPSQTGHAGTAGGIMSWRGPRLSSMKAFVAKNGGDPNRPSAQLQAQFFLHENPKLIDELNNAKSAEEAQRLMNNAWQFAGFDKPGGEAARRFAMANNLAPQFGGEGNPAIDMQTTGASGVASSPSRSSGVVASPDDQGSASLSGLFNGKGFHLSDDQRMALLSAGLGMMAGTSPNFATNIGTGGLKGIESWRENQKLNREGALASSEIANRKGLLGLEGQRVDIAGKQLALEAQKNAADIGQTTANTANLELANQTNRWQQTITPAGIIIRDMTNPNSPPKLTTWEDIQKNGPPSELTSNESIGAGVASGSQAAPAPQQAPQGQSAAPVTAAPTQPVAGPQQFVTQAPAKVPVDGRLFSPSGQGIVAAETTDGLKDARQQYQGATSAQVQLEEMKHDMTAIDNSTWTTPGSGFQSRVAWAKTINTAFQGLGVEPPIDEKAVAAGEDLNKLSTRLGFDLSSTLGSREAASVVDQAVSAVPGGYNSKEGAQRIIAGIEAANQRKIDYYRFLQDWSAKSGGSILGADDYFNKVNPPEKYANAALLNLAAVPHSQAEIDTAPKGTMFNIDGQLMVK